MGFFADWGSTAQERAGTYPCDRHLANATAALYRAVDIDAPAPLVFLWLCQLRQAPYSYDWLDNRGHKSPPSRNPENAALAVGQQVMRIFRLVEFERDTQLTAVLQKTGFYGELAVTYLVTPRGERGSRLFVKLAGRPRSWLVHAFVTVGDLVMMRKQLLTFKALAEAEARTAPAL